MNKAEIISRHAQALKRQVGTGLAIDECEDIMASMMNEAINFIHCCTELRDKEAPKIEEWLKDNFKRLDRHSFTNTHEDTIWLRSELVEVYNQLHP